ncbi:uncharacterized protein LOC104878704 isoform X2 [Vitis vinifera]|uniref:uncharacterized protein LOC104878704 isoform X2 n=1 Tax=Vitis vinifera TaxID=29760 RepID=UPI0028833401|nr:uncharacterized protein LOC104878704 isoform X2 [Vitis vinifera]
MAAAKPAGICFLMFCIVFLTFPIFPSIAFANEHALVVGQSTILQVSPWLAVENSPGSRPGTAVLCERVQIRGLSRIKNLRKFSHSVKVKVSVTNSSARLPNVEVCFHRNESLGIGMCPQGQWEKLTKGPWVRSMSPFDQKVLDIRMAPSSFQTLDLSIEEEFFLYRIVFLVLGMVMLMLAFFLSKSLVFYYTSAMAIGVLLVILMVLFQVGLGSFFLRYLPGLLHSILVEIGISEDMYNPLATFLLIFVVVAGAWLGFWVVRKLVLTEDGSIDISTSHFVAWSIRSVAAVMILQSSLDPLLAAGALICGILVSGILRRVIRLRFFHHLYKNLFRTPKSSQRRSQIPDSLPYEDPDGTYPYNVQRPAKPESFRPQYKPFTLTSCNSPIRGLSRTPPDPPSASETYYSTFHNTPERGKFSKDEWENFTRESTKKALEELVASPDFSKWAVGNAERITLTPNKVRPGTSSNAQRRWFLWF